MKLFKKLTASVLAVAVLAGTTACNTIGGDKSWAVKNDQMQVPIGAYIYYLNEAYSMAQAKVKDTAKPVLEQKVENKEATQWIKDTALTSSKRLLVLNDKMKELNLKLTDEETKNVSSLTDQQWGSYSAQFEKYGVAKSSFNLAFSDYYTKYQKVFNALYGKGGKQEVKDDTLKAYFEKNYSSFSYIAAPKADITTGKSLDDAGKKKLKEEFDGYANEVVSSKKTMQQVADAYKASTKQDQDQLFTSVENLNQQNGYPEQFASAVKAMKAGETKSVDVGDYIVLISKDDITAKTSAYLESNRTELLSASQGEAFEKMLNDEANAYKDVQVNEHAINSYDPKIFVQETTSSAAASEEAASAAK